MPHKLKNVSGIVIITLVLLSAQGSTSFLFAGAPIPNPIHTDQPCLIDSLFDRQILIALDALYQMDYDKSDSNLTKIPPSSSRTYFLGIVAMNRFNDLGDTAALFEAERQWKKFVQAQDSLHTSKPFSLSNNDAMYLGLTELQLSYIANIKAQKFQSTRLALKAVERLKLFPHLAEATAAIALYEYYKADLFSGISWVPFVKSDPNSALSQLEKSIPQSRYLSTVFETSLLWLYYDKGRYTDGLNRIDHFLSRYPQNRLYRQMRADFQFRMGNFTEARTEYEALRDEYLSQKKISASFTPSSHSSLLEIGYLSAVGNLIKIYYAQKQTKLAAEQVSIWNARASQKTMPWLPKSLKKEVKHLIK